MSAAPKGLQISTPTDTAIVLTRTFNAPCRLVWEAERKISFARRSSFTSRSSTFTRACSSVVTAARCPVSTSRRLIQLLSVWAAQPILLAIDSIAAHWGRCSFACSYTSRTARSRTSGREPRAFHHGSNFSPKGASGNAGAIHSVG